ncbi:hypothetical protein VNO78_33344 [Psophocarpus tetragonolobus]|uniref:glucan endo-1,3-beta-D-glucosidase n=1 Tax=Psophocarpus tetragonolobus TaxID=3891 RepID=A0AAN9RL93_PSOTE
MLDFRKRQAKDAPLRTKTNSIPTEDTLFTQITLQSLDQAMDASCSFPIRIIRAIVDSPIVPTTFPPTLKARTTMSAILVLVGIFSSITDANAATNWVNKYVTPYSQDVNFKYIAVGNEILPGDNEAQYILSVMTNIQNVISSANLQIKVSTAIDSTLITNPYPPNDGVFTNDAEQYIRPILNLLMKNGAPLLANVYPYFAYAGDQQNNIPLSYALFTQQGTNSVGYQNLFDAMLDSIYAALEKVEASNLQIVVSESGWPSEGGIGATIDNAATYYANLISHASGGTGTPKRPGVSIETYLFAIFDENQKQGAETERHFGLFSPDKTPKYQLNFN